MAVRRPQVGPVITLAEILARDVSIEWHEAAAVVVAVTESIDETDGVRLFVPDLEQIALSPVGTVSVIGAAAVESTVARLGLLLQALLGRSSEAPVKLRLVIAQATAPVRVYQTVRAFASDVSFFERPGRAGVIAALYARAAAAPMSAAAGPPATLDALAGPAPAETPGTAKTEGRPHRKRRRTVAGAVALAVVVLAAAYVARPRVIASLPLTRGSAAVARAARIANDTALSSASALTERLGLGRLVAAEAPAARPPAAPVAAPRRALHRPAGYLRAKRQAVLAFDLERVAVPSAEVGSSGEATVVEERAAPASVADDGVPPVYSAESAGVVPPVARQPQFSRDLPPSLDRDRLARVQVVVGADGRVDSVMLLDPPRDVHDAMFLSVAKAWEFRPATKDGMPVRYRKTIWVLPE